MTIIPPAGSFDPWGDAVLCAALLALDPAGLKGIRLIGRPGVERDAWLQLHRSLIPSAPHLRMSASQGVEALAGGLDLGATLSGAGPVRAGGLLERADGGTLVLAMAERVGAHAASMIAQALDDGSVRVERDGFSLTVAARLCLIALDEAEAEEEALPVALCDRMGLTLDLRRLRLADGGLAGPTPEQVAAARLRLAAIALPGTVTEAITTVATLAQTRSLRPAILACRTARAIAALEGADVVTHLHAATALRLVLGDRIQHALDAPQSAEAPSQAPEPERPEGERQDESESERRAQQMDALTEILLQAATATLPQGLLAQAQALMALPSRSSGEAGRRGSEQRGVGRGRAIGSTTRPSGPGARLDLIATLRQAAPMARMRAHAPLQAGPVVPIRKEDLRYRRCLERKGTTTLFVVDASGSAALERLAEAKGAVERLLAECYSRRDMVALVAFRGAKAQTLLAPTRSLLRAKSCLCALPGGGGTPLADGIRHAAALGTAEKKRGRDVVAVFLTDGRANIGLDGQPGRAAAMEDARLAALHLRQLCLSPLVIDISARPQPQARDLAGWLCAPYLALPRAGERAILEAALARRHAG